MKLLRFLICLVFMCGLVARSATARILDIQDFTTPGGISVWMVEDHSLPVAALSFAFRAGAASAPADRQGVTQLLSNTLDEGAGDLPSKAFQGRLRDLAIDLSFSSGRDSFSGDLRTLSRHKDEAFTLLKLALTRPRFDAEAVDRMRAANLSRIRQSQGDASWIAARLLYDRMYRGHPYALNAGGTIATLQHLSADDLRAERKRIFARDRLVVGVTGDLTRAEAARLVDDVFGDLPAKAAPVTLARSAMPDAGKPVFYAKDMPQTVLSMAWDGVGIHDPDYYAAVVMNYIFGGGGFSSRLMDEVREARGLTYGISSDMTLNDFADRYEVSASMQPQNVRQTIDMVRKIAQEMATTDVSADALAGARDYLVGSLSLSFSSSVRIADALAGLQLARRPSSALDDYRAKIEAVTPADIRRVAQRIFAKDPVIVMVGAAPPGIDFETVQILPNTEKPTP